MNEKDSKKIRSVFTVKDKKYLTPHLIRVVFEINEEQLVWLSGVRSGSNNKLFISTSDEEKPQVRTYTNRQIDLVAKELSIDFVHHGDDGLASTWAINAAVGDSLEIGMKESMRTLVPDAAHYLIAGDATALPVIAAILEQLPSGVKVKAFIEVATKEDELVLSTPADVDLEWIHNPHPEQGSVLAERVKAFEFDDNGLASYIYLAAEYDIIKTLRHYFRVEKYWNPKEMYACSYWKIGAKEGEHSDEIKP